MSDFDQSEPFESDLEDVSANPKTFPFLNELDLDQDVVRRLTLHLQSIVRGNNEVYTTPLVKRVDPLVVLKKVDDIFETNKDKMNKSLIDLELSNRSKYGPRSIAKPWKDRIDSIKSYYLNSRNKSLASINWQHSSNSFRPLTPDKAIDYLKKSTNSGLPYYTKKGLIKKRLLSEFDYLKYRKDPCILFTRTQESGKTRNVWGFPAIDTLIEMCYYAVLLTFQKNLNWRAAIHSPDKLDAEITKIIDHAISNRLSIISIDFSSYDASISEALIMRSFDYIKSLFQPIYHDTIDLIAKRFSSIQILTPSGIITGNHGVPSGSTFTNEVDSIAQYIIAKSSKLVYDGYFQIQGDDGVYAVSSRDSEEFLGCFEDEGLNVNDDKTLIESDFCVYLQKLFHPDYRDGKGVIHGIYPIYRAISRLVYQERWSRFEEFDISGQDYYSIRSISILENCKHHPLFEDLVKLVLELDKYSLKYSKEGLENYVRMMSQGSGTSGTLINQYGDDIKGINKFETVKLIRRLA